MRRTAASIIFLTTFLIMMAACQKVEPDPRAEILAVMQAAQDGWNRGDLEAYMQSYRNAPETRFAGRDQVTRGWEQVLRKYQAGYPDRQAMGRLAFSEMEVTVTGPDHALVFGRWLLRRAAAITVRGHAAAMAAAAPGLHDTGAVLVFGLFAAMLAMASEASAICLDCEALASASCCAVMSVCRAAPSTMIALSFTVATRSRSASMAKLIESAMLPVMSSALRKPQACCWMMPMAAGSATSMI